MKWIDIDTCKPMIECEVLITLRYFREENGITIIKDVVTTALYNPDKDSWFFDPPDYDEYFWDYTNITAWSFYPQPYHKLI